MSRCLICDSDGLVTFYEGSIRMGSFGKQSTENHVITECPGCGARHLPPIMEDLENYYRSEEYRNDLDQGNEIDRYFELTDDDQPFRLDLLGPNSIRGKRIADVGCGAGPFLDLVKGLTAETVAIEPNEAYHASLKERGHSVHGSLEEAGSSGMPPVDVAVSFSVIEHVDKPRDFLEGIRKLLKPGGRALVSTPNAEDFMIGLSPDYQKFFYRKVHLWYFTAAALEKTAELAGFRSCKVMFKHRFDLSNAMLWLRDKRPTGLSKIDLPPQVDNGWKDHLEASGGSDYLYAILEA